MSERPQAGEPNNELYAALSGAREPAAAAPGPFYRFLVSPHVTLDGRAGLDALKPGKDSDVIAAAGGIARSDLR